MKTLTDWAELLEAVQPFLASTSPFEAMREAGFIFGGSLGESIDRGRPAQTVDPRLLEELQRDYPPPPSMRLYVGRPRPVLLSRAGGYRAIVSGELGLLNEILAELWRVRTIPNVFDQKFTKDHG